MSQYRVAVDAGGTFTDVFVFNEQTNEIEVAKTPSMPENPERGVVNGVDAANVSGKDISLLSHGTTVGTNALIERKLPKTALIATKGFRDVTEIRRGTKSDLWDAYKDVAPPYIERRNRFEVNERVDYKGNVLTEIQEEEVKALAKTLKQKGIESVAICFMNAYVNGENERKVKAVLEEELDDVYVCTSSQVLPEIFEHERTSTTIINAVLGPIMSQYMGRLEDHMKTRGYKDDILVLHSGGGVMTSEMVPRLAARVASSGIAAGAIASKHIAQLCGFNNAIGLDMGGTSCDISLMYEGDLPVTKDWYIEYGYPIGFPSVEVRTIGAGGGSLARIDDGGSLRNGPESAGADPGPACYGLGGEEPTNTDANLILGRLNDKLLDGQLTLEREAAVKSVQSICENFGFNEYEAANAILKVANANMSDALRLISVQKGYDPRDFALVAFGGAGALQSAYLAKELEIPSVIVPKYPGVSAALGCLLVDVRHDITQTFVANLDDIKDDELEEKYIEMEKEAIGLLEKEKIKSENMTLIRHLEMRYSGQWRSLEVTINRPLDSLDQAVAKFHQEHERAYAFSDIDKSIEIYGLRVEAVGSVSKPQLPKEEPQGTLEDALKEYRDVYFEESNGIVQTPIYNRADVPVDSRINGPAVVEQLDSTVVIPPEFQAYIDKYKNIIISLVK
ncbi:hydantoinase/oxoprolinase family protein [Lentibacillus sp. CBA3610]|uniref:hydantoinase/oxoprolinase family protein n=1 Tax=Lentibacillus sp. CBA3610 TaxID=2518176 RepID=UPI0015953A0C|nr:hydantoinase/oxoprolinase family protein [Lentibacillus sp. CBA3610]QKY68319.1 hydantoinase/oxoprolinase family protein [Lentibacillus sp. CBA3610]